MGDFKAYHHSQEGYYRYPFGAVDCGSLIRLRIAVDSSSPELECELRVWEEKRNREKILRMTREEGEGRGPYRQVFTADYQVPEEPGLVWYYFRLRRGEQLYYYGNNREGLGGEGALAEQEPPGYQITVFKPRPVPAWYKRGIMYQIFVDRFHPGRDPVTRSLAGKPLKKKGLMHLDWYDTPFYIRDEEGRIERWTFFGGNLEGIIAKLDYLRELGVSILYLNPIFEAASSHKYDTGDYLKIDPMYGDEETFRRLTREAEARGIRVILDGVFSHTGADSIYFNKYGNYPGLGAFQSKDSPYYHWYIFREYPHDYESWWGVDALPNVQEMEPSYREFIYGGEDSVIKHWLKAGAKGWRLDVADELPDEFIKELAGTLKEADPEAILIGEVWEDASNKISYGKRREYLWGEELDAVMNYPLRQIWLDFLLGRAGAHLTHRRIMSLYENYPRENYYAAMNLIGSHDRIRILTLLGEAPPEESLPEKEKEDYRLPPQSRELAVRRLKLLVLLQMTFPGVPCIYYGDEAGMEGYSDPYNRGPYPWGREDRELLDWYRRATKLRQEYKVLVEGDFRSFWLGEDLYGFKRWGAGEKILVLVNRSVQETRKVKGADLPVAWGEKQVVLDLWDAREETGGGEEEWELPPLGAKILYLRQKGKQQATAQSLSRAAGVLLPVTALPGPFGIGDFGEEAYRFVDFLAAAGQRIWQILPLNPLGPGNSPYLSPSAFAGNRLLVDPYRLVQEGLLTETQIAAAEKGLPAGKRPDRVDYGLARQLKESLLKEAFGRFPGHCSAQFYAGYLDFRQENAWWLEDYCHYMALKEGEPPEYYRFEQYIFNRQWQKLKLYANHRGIVILGDLPIYVAPDSCDTWAHPGLFCLDEEGKPLKVAGVPPDYFSPTGQHWGNPLYDWEEHAKTGYRWWLNRIRHALSLVDYLRLDHFRGFEAYWELPGDAETGEDGYWRKGPGKEFFEALFRELGPLPLIVEDLGFITPEVHNLKTIFRLPGMKVFQFSAEEMLAEVKPGDVFYTGTHDNDTLLSWCRENKDRLAKLTGNGTASPRTLARKVIELLYQSEAPWVIVPLQDILGLGGEARMNVPGTVNGNWEWQLDRELLTKETANWLKKLALDSGRTQ